MIYVDIFKASPGSVFTGTILFFTGKIKEERKKTLSKAYSYYCNQETKHGPIKSNV